MEPTEALQALDLVVARVVAAERSVGYRGPTSTLSLDLGTRGSRQAELPVPPEDAKALVGRQVVCAAAGETAIVLAVQLPEGVVPIVPASDVEDGAPVT